MINIKCFGKKKSDSSSTSSSSGGGYANVTQNTSINGVYMWGQYHDHTNDVDGDITTSGAISAQGDITTPANMSGNNITLAGNITATGSLQCDDITCDDINSGGDIHTTDIHCANINCAGDIETDNIEANNGTITNLIAEYLTVTKQAHFFELVIDKIKSNAGQVILSAANAIIDEVKPVTDGYKLYWRCKDTDTNKQISNDFALNDQVRCQTFNVHEGTNFNVDNKYYWRLVTDTGTETITLDGEQVECNYIEVSDTDKDGTSIPEVGDEIVQLGNRTDTSRQNAIIISAVTSPDPNVTAPSIVQYKGINSYSLNNRILNQIAANGNTFTGNFMVVNGNTTDNILNLITGTQPTITTDTEASFITTNDIGEMSSLADAQNLPTNIALINGSRTINYSSWTSNSYIKNDWQQVQLKPANTYSETGLYISEIAADGNGGVDVDWNFSQDGSLYSNYQIEIYIEWTEGMSTYHTTKTIPVNVLMQNNTIPGADAEFDRLQILTGDATVGLDDTLNVAFSAQIQHVKGNTTSILSDISNYSMNVMYNNGDVSIASKDTGNHRFTFTDTIANFSLESNIPTNISFMLIKQESGQTILVDNAIIDIKFNAGSIFEVKQDAIRAAVTSSESYTDGRITQVNTNMASIQIQADQISSRVTAIEGDYVTSSDITQTANQITLNVYDELRNRTGIDVQSGQITLNANNTIINGNLNLNNTDNGITIYDTDGTARIQLQPDNIGALSNFDGGASYQIRSTFSGTNLSTYSQTTEKKKIGQFNANDTMTITNIGCFLESYDTQNLNAAHIERPTGSIGATIRIYREGNNSAITSFSRTFTYSSTTNSHSTGDITYTIPSNGVYLLNVTFSYNTRPQYQYVHEEIYAVINQTIQHQTYIGADGMYCNPQHDAMFWAGSDAIVTRWNKDGIKVDNECLQRVVNTTVLGEPEYLPFDNYTRVKSIGSDQYTLYNNTYTYTIQPLYDYGVLSCACPSYDDGNYLTRVNLPPFTFYSVGVQYQLPVGYTVKIANYDGAGHTGSWSVRQYIYVYNTDLNKSWTVQDSIVTFVHLGGGLWTVSK